MELAEGRDAAHHFEAAWNVNKTTICTHPIWQDRYCLKLINQRTHSHLSREHNCIETESTKRRLGGSVFREAFASWVLVVPINNTGISLEDETNVANWTTL